MIGCYYSEEMHLIGHLDALGRDLAMKMIDGEFTNTSLEFTFLHCLLRTHRRFCHAFITVSSLSTFSLTATFCSVTMDGGMEDEGRLYKAVSSSFQS